MNEYMIADIVSELIKSHAIRDEEELRIRAERALRKFGKDKIFETWTVKDVMSCAKDNDRKITKAKAREILREIDHHFDADIGINWDVISSYIFDTNPENDI
jgi:ABC-type uncharacterized transport system ATPase subunit